MPVQNNREKIKKAYVEYLLENGSRPPSAFKLTKSLKLTEADFYTEYNSLEAVEADVWVGMFEEAHTQTVSQDVYEKYMVREKLLSFYYTWIEILKQNRSFVLYTAREPRKRGEVVPSAMYSFKKSFVAYANELIQEGRATGEVINRPFLTDRYADGFWFQLLFVLQFWIKDHSQNFEQTDAAIEKAVNTSFDFIGKSAFDSLFDLAKFVYQNRV